MINQKVSLFKDFAQPYMVSSLFSQIGITGVRVKDCSIVWRNVVLCNEILYRELQYNLVQCGVV